MLSKIILFEIEHLTYDKLVTEINRQVKEIVNNNAEPEAISNDHLGVRYITDFHGCIESQFNKNWNDMFERLYAISEEKFKSEIGLQIRKLVEYLDYLQKAFEKKVDDDP